jgi:BA14K-like protein
MRVCEKEIVMISPLKTTALAAVLAATTLTAFAPPAYANWFGWWGTGSVQPLYPPSGYVGTAPLAAPGAVAAMPLYGPGFVTTALQPWSPEWFRYCENRYMTFNANTGYFIDSTGQPHFCGR